MIIIQKRVEIAKKEKETVATPNMNKGIHMINKTMKMVVKEGQIEMEIKIVTRATKMDLIILQMMTKVDLERRKRRD